jgi:hypothetical protein
VPLPTFLFIGADKAGSTWLFSILRQHPRCFVAPAKDLYFFDRFYDRGLDWYRSFFDAVPASALAIGELSHDYLYSQDAADRIAATLPEVRLVAFLRAPVERTFSEYLYLVRSGLARPGDLRRALDRHPEALDHSRYARHLAGFVNRFPTDRLGVFLYDGLQADPASFARDVLGFLGLEAIDGIAYGERVLRAARPRSRMLARTARAAAATVRAAGMPTLVGRAKASVLTRVLYAPYADEARPTLSPSDREWLHTELDSSVVELEALLGLDLSGWRRGES